MEPARTFHPVPPSHHAEWAVPREVATGGGAVGAPGGSASRNATGACDPQPQGPGHRHKGSLRCAVTMGGINACLVFVNSEDVIIELLYVFRELMSRLPSPLGSVYRHCRERHVGSWSFSRRWRRTVGTFAWDIPLGSSALACRAAGPPVLSPASPAARPSSSAPVVGYRVYQVYPPRGPRQLTPRALAARHMLGYGAPGLAVSITRWSRKVPLPTMTTSVSSHRALTPSLPHLPYGAKHTRAGPKLAREGCELGLCRGQIPSDVEAVAGIRAATSTRRHGCWKWWPATSTRVWTWARSRGRRVYE